MKSEFAIKTKIELEKRFQESGMSYLLAHSEETAILEWRKIVIKNLCTQ